MCGTRLSQRIVEQTSVLLSDTVQCCAVLLRKSSGGETFSPITTAAHVAQQVFLSREKRSSGGLGNDGARLRRIRQPHRRHRNLRRNRSILHQTSSRRLCCTHVEPHGHHFERANSFRLRISIWTRTRWRTRNETRGAGGIVERGDGVATHLQELTVHLAGSVANGAAN